MKRTMLILFLFCALHRSNAQSFELQQLILDVQKLTQMKQILSDMKAGYAVVSKGYSTIRDISQGNFSLHEAFLDGLWLVNPSVRKYWKIPEIINNQVNLLKQYQSAYNNFKQQGRFSPDEITYMGRVYNNLLDRSLKNIGDLMTIITAKQFRMSDGERLQSIDRIYSDMQDMCSFLRQFNNNNAILSLQRFKQENDAKRLKRLYGLY
ncbi:MAG: TerB family tellurite resistance protein [Sphingobacteriia bacterium]|nr:TerB family tellurite resistance protein [Sphingobacteriia bacterium]